ncbi:hypothetical protein [Candidatus Hodgkinia cicadicola]|uniref:hypothetical protein n=1 Tax=Candidatus Hodgkinia cicadicola TaxID=573658 RepID=UPI001788CA45
MSRYHVNDLGFNNGIEVISKANNNNLITTYGKIMKVTIIELTNVGYSKTRGL